mgnify:CR=1 FL=1
MKDNKMKFKIEGAAITALAIVAVILLNLIFSVLGEKVNLKLDLAAEFSRCLTRARPLPRERTKRSTFTMRLTPRTETRAIRRSWRPSDARTTLSALKR